MLFNSSPMAQCLIWFEAGLTTPACLSIAYVRLLDPFSNILETIGFSTPCNPPAFQASGHERHLNPALI